MIRRLSALRLVSVVVALAGGFAVGCGDDDTEVASVVTGPPSFSIDSPSDGDCVVLHDDPGMSIRVRISVENWLLRPFGYCGTQYQQCGYAVFSVDDTELVRSASRVTDVPFAEQPTPGGAHRLKVELRNDVDVVVLDADGEPLLRGIDVVTVVPDDTCG